MNVAQVVGQILPSPELCREAADRFRAENPGLSSRSAALKAVKGSRKWVAASGAAAGLLANPFMMLPAAAADVAHLLKVEAQVAGVVAALMEPTALEDAERLHADILSILFPEAMAEALEDAGACADCQLKRAIVQKVYNKSVAKAAGRVLSRVLGARMAQDAVLTKSLPVVGAGLSASRNWNAVYDVGIRAIRYYSGEALPTGG